MFLSTAPMVFKMIRQRRKDEKRTKDIGVGLLKGEDSSIHLDVLSTAKMTTFLNSL